MKSDIIIPNCKMLFTEKSNGIIVPNNFIKFRCPINIGEVDRFLSQYPLTYRYLPNIDNTTIGIVSDNLYKQISMLDDETKEINKIIDADIPSTLFKYTKPWHAIKCINSDSLYYALPSEFEDKHEMRWMDCILESKINEAITNCFLSFNIYNNKYFNNDLFDLMKIIVQCLDIRIYKNIKDKQFSDVKDPFGGGILCLTDDFDNKLMWNKYANNETGVALVVDVDKQKTESNKIDNNGNTIKVIIRKVCYVDNILSRFIMSICPSNSVETALCYFIKQKRWSFEKEYRVFYIDDSHKDSNMLKPTDDGMLAYANKRGGEESHKLDGINIKGVILGERFQKNNYSHHIDNLRCLCRNKRIPIYKNVQEFKQEYNYRR